RREEVGAPSARCEPPGRICLPSHRCPAPPSSFERVFQSGRDRSLGTAASRHTGRPPPVDLEERGLSRSSKTHELEGSSEEPPERRPTGPTLPRQTSDRCFRRRTGAARSSPACT